MNYEAFLFPDMGVLCFSTPQCPIFTMGKANNCLHPSAIQYLVARTGFSATEIRRLHRCFRQACKNTSAGHIDLNRVHFTALYKQAFAEADSLRFSEIAFRLFDTDGNGKVNFNEFVTLMNLHLKCERGEKLDMLFRLYDLAGNQYISRGEAERVISALHGLNGGLVPREATVSPDVVTNAIFRHIVTSQQKELNKETFVKLALESSTLRLLLEGTLKAICRPFLKDQCTISSA